MWGVVNGQDEPSPSASLRRPWARRIRRLRFALMAGHNVGGTPWITMRRPVAGGLASVALVQRTTVFC